MEEEKEKKEIEVDIDFPTEKIVEIFTKFIADFFKDKDFNGKSSVEIRKTRFNASSCHIELEVCRMSQKQL